MVSYPSNPHPFIARLAELQAVTSPQQRQIIEVLLQDPLHGALWGIEEMAVQTNTSVATIIRLTKLLGFNGFSEFRTALKEACETKASPSLGLESHPQPGPLSEVVARDGLNAQTMLQELTPTLLDRAVNMILEARNRVLLGRGSSSLVADMLAYHLAQVGCPCRQAGALPLAHLVANLEEGDLLIVVSLAPYSLETAQAVAFAHECGYPILLLNDSHEAPETRWASLSLKVPCENIQMGPSLAPFAQLAYTLALSTANRNLALVTQRRKAAEQISGAVYVGKRGLGRI